MDIKGSMVAIITPFKNGGVDYETLKKLVNWHIENGTQGLVPCGSTGESATLSHEEHDEVIKTVVQTADGRVPVIAGTGSNNTAEAVRLTKEAKTSGASAALVITPYYNKPTQTGLVEHYKKISDSVDIPIIVYNIAGRTAVNIEPETMEKIANLKNVIGVKEASGNLNQMSSIKSLCKKEFKLISGDDDLTLPVLSIGGVGVISAVANIVPKDMADLIKAFESKDYEKAKEYHYKLHSLSRVMFIETNPIPLKTAMDMMGLCSPELRLPLTPMLEENKAKLKKVLKEYGLI